MVLLAPKLNYNNMNVELMKHFARLQAQDDQGMIRTNTTVCIGKIANYINPQLRQRILLSAFPKAMRDPFPLSRLSGIIALANTDRFYTLKDVASKVLPSLCMLTVDPEKDVRDEAFKTIKIFMQKLEKVSEQPELALEMEKDVQSCNLDVKNETSWTSWAMTSLSAKMTGYKNKNQQPSIALNTQPLGPPPSTLQQQQSPETNKTNKKEIEAPKIEVKKQEQEKANNSGWNLEEDDEWKDLDDEPLEPLETVNLSTNVKKTCNQKSDWSDSGWTNSFEEPVNDDQSDDGIFAVSNKSHKDKAKLPMTSSYNWSSQTTTNQDDLFSSMVKDVNLATSSINSKSMSQINKSPSNKSANNTNSWSNEWNDLASSENSTKGMRFLSIFKLIKY